MGRLTTHVLDTAHGCPADGVAYALYRLAPARERIGEGTTNADGRCDAPLLEGAAMARGAYELDFDAAGYFAARGVPLADPPFLGIVTLRFAIADPQAHYHVPLLVSPWAYATYRGS